MNGRNIFKGSLPFNRLSEGAIAELVAILQQRGYTVTPPASGPVVVNTLTEVTAGKVLDARQGKALADLIDGLTTGLARLGARKAFAAINVTSPFVVNHDFGTLLGLTTAQYHLQVQAEAANGDQIVGIRVAKTSANSATLLLADTSGPFNGTFVLLATPF